MMVTMGAGVDFFRAFLYFFYISLTCGDEEVEIIGVWMFEYTLFKCKDVWIRKNSTSRFIHRINVMFKEYENDVVYAI
jgi:hypothetical protein